MTKRILAWLTAILVVVLPAAAADDVSELLAYRETFDGVNAFGGIIELGGDELWATTLADGLLTYRNDEDSAALHFVDLVSLEFPFGIGLENTDGAIPSARVRVDDTQDGGIGLIVGFPHGGDYLGFTIGRDQRFTVVQKRDGKLRRLEFGTHDAVLSGEFNDISVTRSGPRLRFLVNGTEVFATTAYDLADAPVGIAVFGKGQFSFDEVSVVAPRLVARVANKASGCDLPAAGGEDLIALLGAYEGAAASSVTVAGQDEPTSTIAVRVEPGEGSIYAIVTAHGPMIWRFEGDAARISHVAVIGATSAGVVGITPEKISFHESDGCFSYFSEANRSQKTAEVVTALAMERRADVVIGEYDPAAFVLPAGTVVSAHEATPVGIDPRWDLDIVKEALRFNPGGLVQIDPDDVVSPASIESYDVLPQEFGLAQIVAEGTAYVADPHRHPLTFHVVKPMARFPAGLAGAHQVKFVLYHGVPMPAGSPGHSDVTIADMAAVPPPKPPPPIELVPFRDGPHRFDLADGTFIVQEGFRPYPSILVCGTLALGLKDRLQQSLDRLAPGVFTVGELADPAAVPRQATLLFAGLEDPLEACGDGAHRKFNDRMRRDAEIGHSPQTGCGFSRSRGDDDGYAALAIALMDEGRIDDCFDRMVQNLLGLRGRSPALSDPDHPLLDDVRDVLGRFYRGE